jgi:hypothetical protein
MNLNQALALAGKESQQFIGRPAAKCPFDKTGLLVLVYRSDTKDAIANAQVELSGTARPKEGGTQNIAGQGATADANGVVHDYKPCSPGSYHIAVKTLPDGDKLYATPYPTADQEVSVGTCPVCSIPVDPRKYWVKVRLVDKDSGADIGSGKVKIKLPDGWKTAAGGTEQTESTAQDGTGADKKMLAQFKDLLPGGTQDRCSIELVEADIAMEFVDSASA